MNSAFFHNVIAVAKSTFRESIRDRVLYAILAFAFVYITFTIFLASISLGEDLHVVRSLGLAGAILYGSLKCFHGSIYGLVAGLCLAIISLSIEAIRFQQL